MKKLVDGLALLLIALSLTGCPQQTTSSTGITVWTSESTMGIPNSQFGVPGTFYALSVSGGGPGPNSQGHQSVLSGVTGSGGMASYADAITDSNWAGYADFTFTIPPCGVTQVFTNYVPPSGALIDYDCQVF